MRRPPSPGLRAVILPVATIAMLAGCASAAGSAQPAAASATATATASAAAGRTSAAPPAASPAVAPSGAASAAPESGGTTAAGDIPDNAVFLTFHGASSAFSIQYVEGWQVTRQPDGVVIRDKDSSETVAIVAPVDVPTYLAATDLPALQAQSGFKLVTQDTVKVGSASYVHLVFHLPAAPDPVTGKQVPSTVDRYYVPGPTGLAVVSLSTPDGVDNVDAFRQMIESFTWS
jgi:hypothetical protein